MSRPLAGMCKCSDKPGRNLVVCIDGAHTQLGAGNTHVFDMFSKGSKTEHAKQLTYYSDGMSVGLASMTSLFRNFAAVYGWNYESIVMGAYRWLIDNYQEDDKIFCIGYSRGAYHVRTLAAMIEKVGLINRYKGNEEQISLVFRYYASSNKDTQSRFKSAFAWDGARVHFVGVWETTLLDMSLVKFVPLPYSEDNVCFFRQALALDERRGRFQPICALGKARPPAFVSNNADPDSPAASSAAREVENNVGSGQDFESIPRIKEVWFPGSHSQIGGTIMRSEQAGGNLRRASYLWMSFEAVSCGMHLHPSRVDWDWDDLQTRPVRISFAWMVMESLPVRSTIVDAEGNYSTAYRLNFLRSRTVMPGQKVHPVAFHEVDYRPSANISSQALQWSQLFDCAEGEGQGTGVKWGDYVERDYLEPGLIPSVIQTLKTGAGSRGVMWAYRLAAMTLTDQGIRTLKNTPSSSDDLSQIFSQVDDANIQERLIEVVERSTGIYGPSTTSPLLSPDHFEWLLRVVKEHNDMKFRSFAFRLLASSLDSDDSLENLVDGKVLGTLDEMARDEKDAWLADGAHAMFKTVVGHDTLSRKLYALNTLSVLRKRFTSGDSHSQRVSKTFFRELLQHARHRQHLFDNDVLQYWLTKIEFLDETERILFTLFLRNQYEYMSNEFFSMLTLKLSNKTNDRQVVGQSGLFNVLSILRDIAQNERLVRKVWDDGIKATIQQASSHINHRIRLLALDVFGNFASFPDTALRSALFDQASVHGLWNTLNDIHPGNRSSAAGLLVTTALDSENGFEQDLFDKTIIAAFIRSISERVYDISSSAIMTFIMGINRPNIRANILSTDIIPVLRRVVEAEHGNDITRGCAFLFFVSIIPFGVLDSATMSVLGVAGDATENLQKKAIDLLASLLSQNTDLDEEIVAALRIPILMSLDGFSFALEPIQRYITAVLSQEHLRNIFNAATVKRIQQALTSGTPSFLQDSDSLLARAILTSEDIRDRIFDKDTISRVRRNISKKEQLSSFPSQLVTDLLKDVKDEKTDEEKLAEVHSSLSLFSAVSPGVKGYTLTVEYIDKLKVLLGDEASDSNARSGVIDLLTYGLSRDDIRDRIFGKKVLSVLGNALSDAHVAVRDSSMRFFTVSLHHESIRDQIFNTVDIPTLLKAGFETEFWSQEFTYRRAFDHFAVSRLCRQLSSDPRSRQRTVYFISEAIKHDDIHARICTEDLRKHFDCPIHQG